MTQLINTAMKHVRLLAFIAILFTPSAILCAADAKFDVTAYGAKGDGLTKNTVALQKVIDTCAAAGGGKVVFPKGKYLTGSITLRSNVELHLDEDATLLGSTLMEDYPTHPFPKFRSLRDKVGFPALIYAEEAEHVTLTGPGTIDGQGAAFQPSNVLNNEDIRPRGIVLISCKDVRVQGGLYLCNAGSWTQHYLNCENVEIHNIEVFGHVTANNDCIDIDGCRHVRVSGIRGDTYDDGITLKATGPSDCEDVVVEDCTIASHCAAIKCGTETTGGFKNIMYRNCQVVPSVTGHHFINGSSTARTAITLIITDGGTMENVWFDEIEATDCITPIFVTLGNRSRKYTADVPKPGIGRIENIKLSNIKATGAGPISSSVTGLDTSHQIKNVTLENISLTLTAPGNDKDRQTDMDKVLKRVKPGYPSPESWGNLPSYGFYFRYIDGLQLKNIELKSEKKDPRDPIVTADCLNVVGLQ